MSNSRPRYSPAHRRCCSQTVGVRKRHVLFLGAERLDEFEYAARLIRKGYRVLVINPRETASATEFRKVWGNFLRTHLENLSPVLFRFDLILENYPYPLRRCCAAPRRFALARLQRLAPGGCWIVVTESPRFATALKALADFDPDIASRFHLHLRVLSPDDAPASVYPVVDTRIRLIFQRNQ